MLMFCRSFFHAGSVLCGFGILGLVISPFEGLPFRVEGFQNCFDRTLGTTLVMLLLVFLNGAALQGLQSRSVRLVFPWYLPTLSKCRNIGISAPFSQGRCSIPVLLCGAQCRPPARYPFLRRHIYTWSWIGCPGYGRALGNAFTHHVRMT